MFLLTHLASVWLFLFHNDNVFELSWIYRLVEDVFETGVAGQGEVRLHFAYQLAAVDAEGAQTAIDAFLLVQELGGNKLAHLLEALLKVG